MKGLRSLRWGLAGLSAIVALVFLGGQPSSAWALTLGDSDFTLNVMPGSGATGLSVCPLANGGFAVGVAQQSQGIDQIVLNMYLLDARGGAMGDPVYIHAYASDTSRIALAPMSGDRILVVWLERGSPDQAYNDLYWIICDSQGNCPTTGKKASLSPLTAQGVVAAGLGNGQAAYAWRADQVGGSNGQAQAHVIDPDTQQFDLIYPLRVDPGSPVALAGLGGGELVMGIGISGEGGWGLGRRYSNSGQQQGGDFYLAEKAGAPQSNLVLAPVAEGGFLAAWVEAPDNQSAGVRARLHGTDGTAYAPQQAVNLVAVADASGAFSLAAAPLASGGSAIFWHAANGDGGSDIWGRGLDSSGNFTAAPVQVNSLGFTSHRQVTAAAGLEQAGLAVWLNQLPGGLGSEIKGRIFR